MVENRSTVSKEELNGSVCTDSFFLASATHGIGVTGLTPQQEWDNRERKYSVNGVDIRKFSNSATGGMEPLNDPYYGRKQVSGE